LKSVRLIELLTSWQGEGPDSGKTATLARFKRCNRDCPWCDTKIKSRNYIETDYTLGNIQDVIDEKKSMLLLTGGEPSYALNLNQSVTLLNDLEYPLANVETNGIGLLDLISKVNSDKNVKYILSPKLFNKEDSVFYYDLVDKIKSNENVYVKLVCENRELIFNFLEYLKDIEFPNNRVYLMPEGTTKDSLINNSPFVFDMCEKYNFNFSSRTHIIYGFI
jgi:organic radical activating enzyme